MYRYVYIIIISIGAIGLALIGTQYKTAWFIYFIIYGIISGIFIMWLERRAHKNVVKNRRVLSGDDIYKQFYAESGIPKELFLNIWHKIADTLCVDADKLRPDDKTETFVNLSFIDSDIEALILSQSYSQPMADDLKTIDSMVRFIAKDRQTKS